VYKHTHIHKLLYQRRSEPIQTLRNSAFAKEPPISAIDPYISAKEPHVSAKEPYISAKSPISVENKDLKSTLSREERDDSNATNQCVPKNSTNEACACTQLQISRINILFCGNIWLVCGSIGLF